MPYLRLLSISVFGVTVLACSTEDTKSDFIKTQEMWASIKIESNGERSRIVAELNVSGSNISLSKEDTFTATIGQHSKILKKYIGLLEIDYHTFSNITADNTLFNVALLRIKDTDADKSNVKLPANFNIYSPQHAQLYRLNSQIPLNWEDLSENKKIKLTLINSCKNNQGDEVGFSESFDIADDGKYQILLDDLSIFKSETLDRNIDCLLSITLIRENLGTIDPIFKTGSKILAHQIRVVKGITIDI